jgi:hypothetical protein
MTKGDSTDVHLARRLLRRADGPTRNLQNLVGNDANAATNLRFRTAYDN